jgi:hypothetical protein
MGNDRPNAIRKQLSHNDTGETGGHQGGICVPREPPVLNFFPSLDPKQKNPRHRIVCMDQFGNRWTFTFIYYNNRLFGGTRNEYRLTCMTKFIRTNNLRAGDTLILSRDTENRFSISFERLGENAAADRLTIGTTWKVIGL